MEMILFIKIAVGAIIFGVANYATFKYIFEIKVLEIQRKFDADFLLLKKESSEGLLRITRDFERKMEMIHWNEENQLPSFFVDQESKFKILEIVFDSRKPMFSYSPVTMQREGDARFIFDTETMHYMRRFTPELLKFSLENTISNPLISKASIDRELARRLADFIVKNNFIYNTAHRHDSNGRITFAFKYAKQM